MSPVRIAVVAVAVVVLVFQLPIFDRWFSHMDEGHVLLFADLVAKGGDLYRDATLYPLPGAFYALAQAFKLFGASILVSRWIVMLEFTLFVVLVYLLMRRLGSPRTAAVAVFGMLVYRIWAFPHWQVYSYSTTALLLLLAAMCCQLRWFDARRTSWLLACGLFFGLAVYCKQDYGAAALLVMTTLFWVEGRGRASSQPGSVAKPVAVFVGAGGAVGALVGLYFAWQGVLPDLIQQTILNHVRGIGSFEYTTYPSLFPLFAQDPALRSQSGLFAFFPGIVTTVDLETLRQDFLFRETFVYDVALKLFYWGSYVFAAYALVRVFRSRAQLTEADKSRAWLAEAMLAGFTAAFVLLLTVNRPQDFLHVAVLVWPMICLSLLYASNLLRARPVLTACLCVLLAIPTISLLGYTARAYLRIHSENNTSVPVDRAGIFARPSEARLLGDVVRFMRENSGPDETVAVMPYFPIVHFLADRVGPDRSAYIVWPFPEFPDRDQRIIASLEEKGTRIAVYNFTQFSTFPTMDVFSPDLFAYLVDHFEIERVFSYDKSGYRLAGLRRSDVTERPSRLVDAAWPEATLWIGSDEAPPLAIAPSERARFVERAAWPFRRTLALRPSTGARRTVLRLPLPQPKQGDVLETAIGLHPDMWFALPGFVTRFEVAVVAPGAEGDRESLFVRTLDPHRDTLDRGWFDVEIPLSAWAGREPWLELSVSVDDEAGESLRVGGFAEPRIRSRTGSRNEVLGRRPGAVAD